MQTVTSTKTANPQLQKIYGWLETVAHGDITPVENRRGDGIEYGFDVKKGGSSLTLRASENRLISSLTAVEASFAAQSRFVIKGYVGPASELRVEGHLVSELLAAVEKKFYPSARAGSDKRRCQALLSRASMSEDARLAAEIQERDWQEFVTLIGRD